MIIGVLASFGNIKYIDFEVSYNNVFVKFFYLRIDVFIGFYSLIVIFIWC